MKDNSTKHPKFAKYLLWFILAIFIFLAGFGLGKLDLDELKQGNITQVKNQNYLLTGDIKNNYKEVDVSILWEIWGNLEKEYIESDIDGQELLYGAARGLVQGLSDPYSAFLTPEESIDYFESHKGVFEGIGASLRQEGEFVVVEVPLEGSPAQSAGVEAGYVILEVDGEDMQGVSVFEVASTIRGEAGTVVEIKFFKPDKSETIDISIIRAKIDLPNIEYKGIEDGVAEIKISKFTEETAGIFNRQWDVIVEEVKKDNPRVVIVDLRNNPGGFVDSVEYVLDEFIAKGEVLFGEKDRVGRAVEYKAKRNGAFEDLPVVVVVNKGSASASEIFAGAIQDHSRGVLVGQETVGKGVEQKLIRLSDGSTLQLVFQYWLTPSGRIITQDNAIVPDVLIEDYQEQIEEAKNQAEKL
jgi:carboxyl-terminal processing protease